MIGIVDDGDLHVLDGHRLLGYDGETYDVRQFSITSSTFWDPCDQ